MFKYLPLLSVVLLVACGGRVHDPHVHNPNSDIERLNSVYERGVCASEYKDLAYANAANLAQVAPGMDKVELYRVMGVPQRATAVRMTDNRLIEILHYLTGVPGCRPGADVPMHGDYLPIMLNGGKVIGYGQQFYDTMVAPAVYQTTPSPVPLLPNTPMSGQPGPIGTPPQFIPNGQPWQVQPRQPYSGLGQTQIEWR